MASASASQPTSSDTSSSQPHTFDRNLPDQKEVSSILETFNKDPKHLSVISLGKDGVLRNLTADRDVLDAVGLSPRLVKAFLDRVPPEYRSLTPELEGVDGSQVPHEQLWHPDSSLLPPPMDEKRKLAALATLEEQEKKKAEEE
jgi:hypothetical protein